jgi:5-methylcytosine-specific restriction endonuclease McrA
MPSSPSYVRDYTQERLNESAQRKAQRVERNKARRIAEAYYGAAAIKGRDIDHKHALSRGGKTTLSNLQPVKPSENRSFRRNAFGAMVSQVSKRESKK